MTSSQRPLHRSIPALTMRPKRTGIGSESGSGHPDLRGARFFIALLSRYAHYARLRFVKAPRPG